MTEYEKLLETFDRLDIEHISYTPGPEPVSGEELYAMIRRSLESVENGEAEEVDLSY